MSHLIDVKWFQERMDACGLNLADLGRLLKKDRSAITRSLKGDRRWQPEEVPLLASALGVTSGDIIDHTAGLEYLRHKLVKKGEKPRVETPKKERGMTLKATLEVGESTPLYIGAVGKLHVVETATGENLVGVVAAIVGENEIQLRDVSGNYLTVKIIALALVREILV